MSSSTPAGSSTAPGQPLAAIGNALKENGKVIVTGCMGAEPESISTAYPDVLAITGPQQYETVVNAVHKALPPKHDPFLDLVPPEGIKLTPRHYAYLKISEGCNNRCTFCIIPRLRGDLVSRPAADVLREAEKLVKAGVKSCSSFHRTHQRTGSTSNTRRASGATKKSVSDSSTLRPRFGEFGVWVRLHYVYPYPHVDDVISLMAERQSAAVPRHPVPARAPRTSSSACDARRRRRRLWSASRAGASMCPDLTLRSTFIVGFPGETDADFEMLLEWLDEASLDRVGCFKYEPVRGAAANDTAAPIPDEVKVQRWHRFMQTQQKISTRRLKRKVGSRQKVIIDDVGPTVAKGRSMADAPEIDGAVYVYSPPSSASGRNHDREDRTR